MTIYRLFFHPLRRFPGPVLARVSKLWHVFHCINSRNYLLLDKLHLQYGEFVRTGESGFTLVISQLRRSVLDWSSIGPSELTIFTPDILSVISSGTDNQFSKPAWYDAGRPYWELTMLRDKHLHDHRRRIWDNAFSTKGMTLKYRYLEYLLTPLISSTHLRGPYNGACESTRATNFAERRGSNCCQQLLPMVQFWHCGPNCFLKVFQHVRKWGMASRYPDTSFRDGASRTLYTGSLAHAVGVRVPFHVSKKGICMVFSANRWQDQGLTYLSPPLIE